MRTSDKCSVATQIYVRCCWPVPCELGAQQRRKVIINQDGSGPGGSNMQTIALLIQSPQVEVLGITVVSGNQWRDEEVAHTLRLLEIMGRTDIPVVPGAAFPLVRTRAKKLKSGSSASARWPSPARGMTAGGMNPSSFRRCRRASPRPKPADEDAAHFLIRKVREVPARRSRSTRAAR